MQCNRPQPEMQLRHQATQNAVLSLAWSFTGVDDRPLEASFIIAYPGSKKSFGIILFNRVGNAPRLAPQRGPMGTRLSEGTSTLVLTPHNY